MQASHYELTDFEVLESIGEGSFSKVKLVRRIADGKIMALKQVSMQKLGMAQKNSALNQIRLLASIQSPYVISYEGSFYSSNSNSLCLLMEYADNGDLENIINKTAKKNKMHKGLAQQFIWKTIIHLLQGLKTLHQSKIVHRDIKPANIFYSKGVAKLGDLNVSTVSCSSFYSTKTGTPYYTAPEIWKGEKYMANCDVWSLGCIVYEMCALIPPFRAETFPELFLSVSRGYYSPLSEEYSEDLRTFVRMCLVIEPTQRPSAAELLNCPILIKRLSQFKNQIDFSGKVDLIKPIKCPKVLRFINSILPQGQQQSQDETSVKGSQKNSFAKKKVRVQQNDQDKRIPSIAKIKTGNGCDSKTTIRIKSCNNIKQNRTQTKSAKLIKNPSIYQKAEQRQKEKRQEDDKHEQKSKISQTVETKKTAKTANFRLRSYKKIAQKQKQNIVV